MSLPDSHPSKRLPCGCLAARVRELENTLAAIAAVVPSNHPDDAAVQLANVIGAAKFAVVGG